jgi:ubiquinone/menaquinone biosynthesis C-methylase UbiE
VLRRIWLAWLFMQGAFWGIVLHGRPRIYTYIPDSLRSFVSIDEFSALLRRSGYSSVDTRSFLLGGIGLHWAIKAE